MPTTIKVRLCLTIKQTTKANNLSGRITRRTSGPRAKRHPRSRLKTRIRIPWFSSLRLKISIIGLPISAPRIVSIS